MSSASRQARKKRCYNVPANIASEPSTTASAEAGAAVDADHAATVHGEDLVGAATPPLATRRQLSYDLWLMVLANFSGPTAQEITVAHDAKEALPPSARERTQVIRSLSQTCRELRDFLHPLLWGHVELCTSVDVGIPWDASMAYSIRKYCLGLDNAPLLALHVQTVTIALARRPKDPVLQVFGRCLGSMRRLRNLNVLSCQFSKEDLRTEFTRRNYPSIREVHLPASTCPILRACPSVRTVKFINDGECQDCMHIIAGSCWQVRRVEGITAGNRKTLDAFLKNLKGLTSLRLTWSIALYHPSEPELTSLQSVCAALASSPRLHEIILCAALLRTERNTRGLPSKLQRFLSRATRVLQALKAPAERKACALYWDKQGERIEQIEQIKQSADSSD